MKTNIYVLIDPITELVRYVGKSNDPIKRLREHKYAKRESFSHKRNWVTKLQRQGLDPILAIIDEVRVDEVRVDEWRYWESYWIEQFRYWGFDLVNHTSGGDGSTEGNSTSFKRGNVPWNQGSARTKECLVCSVKHIPSHRGILWSVAKTCGNRERIAIYRKSLKSSTTFVKGRVPWNKGKSIKNKPSKPILQFDLSDNFIKEHVGCAEAAKTVKGNKESIRNCCLGKSLTAAKYKWKYK